MSCLRAEPIKSIGGSMKLGDKIKLTIREDEIEEESDG